MNKLLIIYIICLSESVHIKQLKSIMIIYL